MAIPEVIMLLRQITEIHEKKNQDYAATEHPYQNFERSAQLMSWFKHDHDKAFVSLIATKLARLSTLLNKTSAPNNESISDTYLDLATYCILWAARYEYLKIHVPSSNADKKE